MWLWSWGGWWLGFLTALLGRNAIWVCTEAVEATVHRHLDHQLKYLAGRDPDLAAIIDDIRGEELEHLHHAQAELAASQKNNPLLSGFIAAATEAVIWLSTWGDSARMARDLGGHIGAGDARDC
jgi:3-demethoxyubiquinol 3-hydroxylase